MNPDQLISWLTQYAFTGGDRPTEGPFGEACAYFDTIQKKPNCRSVVGLPQPSQILYGEHPPESSDDARFCKKIPIEDFEANVQSDRDAVGYQFREGNFQEMDPHDKSEASSATNPPQSSSPAFFKSSADDAEQSPSVEFDMATLYNSLAVCDGGPYGKGVYVAAEDGLPKGTRIPLGGLIETGSEPISQALDNYRVGGGQNHPNYSSLRQGGIGSFIQHAPHRDELVFYTFEDDNDKAKVLVANAKLAVDESTGLAYYTLTEDLPRGAQVLGNYGVGYWASSTNLFRIRPQLFGIPPEKYKPPVPLVSYQEESKDAVPFDAPYYQLENCIREQRLMRPHQEKGDPETHKIEPEYLKAILDYEPMISHPMFNLDHPSLADWISFHQDADSKKFEVPDYCLGHLPFEPSPESQAQLEYARQLLTQTLEGAMAAGDHEAALSIGKFLILKILENPLTTENAGHLAELYKTLATVYESFGEQDVAEHLDDRVAHYTPRVSPDTRS